MADKKQREVRMRRRVRKKRVPRYHRSVPDAVKKVHREMQRRYQDGDPKWYAVPMPQETNRRRPEGS